MTYASTPVPFGAIALAGLVMTIRIAASPIAPVALPERMGEAITTEPPNHVAPVESLTAVAVAHDPFRVTRRPAGVPYDPERAAQPPAPPAPKPTLSLDGVVWDGGVDPSAVVEGLPGVEGPRVVRRGDVVGALRVRTVARDRVVIVGLDTVWTLSMREPWR